MEDIYEDEGMSNEDTYEDEGLIGEGTYGEVFLVSKDGKRYASKISDFRERNGSTLRELRLLSYFSETSSQSHPNIISLVDFIPGDNFEIVLELAEGDLSKLATWNFTERRKKMILYQLAKGLDEMHSNDVVHADIKSANILYTTCESGISQIEGEKDMRVMYSDFGVSSFGTCPGESDNSDNAAYTLWWRPPENLLGFSYSFSADIWALGCTFYEIVTGGILLPGDSDNDQLFKIFRLFGDPRDNNYPKALESPFWSIVINWNRDKPFEADLKDFEPLSEPFRNLLKSMLKLNPLDRITSRELVNHPYFDDVREDVDKIIPCTKSNVDDQPFSCSRSLKKRVVNYEWKSVITDDRRIYTFSFLSGLTQGFKMKDNALFIAYEIFDMTSEMYANIEDFEELSLAINRAIYASLIISSILSSEYSLDVPDFVEVSGMSEGDLYEAIYEVLRIIGRKLYMSTSYDELVLLRRGLSREAKLMTDFFLILISMSPLKYPGEIKALTALYLTSLYYADEPYRFGDVYIKEILDLSAETMRIIDIGNERLFVKGDLCKRYTGIPFSKVLPVIEGYF